MTFEASVDTDQAARFAAPTAARPEAGAAPAPGAEPDAASPAAAEAASAPADAVNTATHADPVAEADAINQRVAGWRYKIAGFQYDQMTRRMADLLKPVG